jgi:hypothetical protein
VPYVKAAFTTLDATYQMPGVTWGNVADALAVAAVADVPIPGWQAAFEAVILQLGPISGSTQPVSACDLQFLEQDANDVLILCGTGSLPSKSFGAKFKAQMRK